MLLSYTTLVSESVQGSAVIDVTIGCRHAAVA